jgi:membrane complex biogenesis BtpA family protein
MNRVPRGLIGVVHLPPMPGDPRYRGGGFDVVEGLALADAEALVTGGVGALVVENLGSAPYQKGTEGERLPPHQVALMALVVRSIAGRFQVPVGVNCLRNDAISALGIAATSGAAFVRVNVHTGAYLTDQGIIEGEAHRSMRYRREIGAEHVSVLADVHVKHAAILAPVPIERAVADTLERGLADAVIVTGQATGEPPTPELLAQVAAVARRKPVILGSGLTPEVAERLLPHVDAAIVGTWVKKDGKLHQPVDVDRVKELAVAAQSKFRRPRAS